jgi:Na+/H+-dicarboxylate symporter
MGIMASTIITTLFGSLSKVCGYLVEAILQTIQMFVFSYTVSEAGVYTFNTTQLSAVGELILVCVGITVAVGIVYGTFRFVRGLLKSNAH